MADLCQMVGCNSLGTKSCAACGVASYCSVECQKGDWKVHKISCVDMKKLPTTYLSCPQLDKYIRKIVALADIFKSKGKLKDAIILLKGCLVFAEHQYGVHVEGMTYCMRGNRDQIDNNYLIEIRLTIAGLFKMVTDPDNSLAHAIEARRLLEHHDKSDWTLDLLAKSEESISDSFFAKEQFDVAEYHCQQSLTFARLIKGDGRLDYECRALNSLVAIHVRQRRYPEAIELSEQSYILVSEAYGPVHPKVQDSASRLIGFLFANKDYSRADDYCRMNYENLTDPRNGIDHDDARIARGMFLLAQIWLKKTPVDDEEAAFALAEEVEDMARKSCSIAVTNGTNMSIRCTLFADVLMKRGKYTDETRMVLEQALAVDRQCPDIPGTDSAATLTLKCLADFHDHVSGTMPPGDARGRELQLRDKYDEEAELLRR